MSQKELKKQFCTINNYVRLYEENDMVVKDAKENNYLFERETFEYWSHITSQSGLKPSKACMVDIGAYTGLYSLFALRCFGYAKAHAFEPKPIVFERMLENARLNNYSVDWLDQFVPINIAIGNTNGFVDLYSKNFDMTSASSLTKSEETTESHTVQLYKLDDINFIHSIDVIKIDVEGHELDVLEGASETIRSETPILIIETLTDDLEEKVIEKLLSLGYNRNNIKTKLDCRNLVAHNLIGIE